MKLYKPVGNKTFWPIGSIYLSVNNTNPSKWFGGTWVQVANGCFLIGLDTNNTWLDTLGSSKGSNGKSGSWSTDGNNGNTGSTTLTVDQIPSHNHSAMHLGSLSGGSNGWVGNVGTVSHQRTGNTGGGKGHTHTLNNHNHSYIPPFYTVIVWKRTA